MKFILRLLSSICVGLAVYLLFMCDPRMGHHIADLFTQPEKFFDSYDRGAAAFMSFVATSYAIVVGLCFFIFVKE